MKKLRHYIIAILAFTLLVPYGYTVYGNTERYQDKGFYYFKSYYGTFGPCAEITGVYTKKLSDTLTIPEYIGFNYPVVELTLKFSKECVSEIRTLNIPASCISEGLTIWGGGNDGFVNLTNANIIGDSDKYISVDGIIYSKDMTKLVYLPMGRTGTYIMPDSLKSIEPKCVISDLQRFLRESVLNGSNYTELITNDRIEKIDLYNSDLKMTNLEKIHMGKMFRVYKEYFDELSKLKEITVSDENQSYSAYDGALYSKDGTFFEYCPQGKEGSFKVKYGTKIIGENAFESSNLSAVYLPKSVKKIKAYAFIGSKSNISDVYVPSSVMEIANNAFAGCEDTITIHSPGGSYAHTYATENGINWVKAEPMVFVECENGKVSADVEYMSGNSKLYLAVYNARNHLVKYFTQFVSDGEYSFDVSNIPGAYKVKAMLWNDADHLTPLCPAATAYVN